MLGAWSAGHTGSDGADDDERNRAFVRREFERLRREGRVTGPPTIAEAAARRLPSGVRFVPSRRRRLPSLDRRVLVGAAVLALLVAGLLQLRARRAARRNERVAEEAFSAWGAAARSGDWQPFLALLDEDVELLLAHPDVPGGAHTGKAAAGAALRRVASGLELSADGAPLRGPDGTVAYESLATGRNGGRSRHVLLFDVRGGRVAAVRHYAGAA